MKLYIKEGMFKPVYFFNYPGLLCLECIEYEWCWGKTSFTYAHDNCFLTCDLFTPYNTYVF